MTTQGSTGGAAGGGSVLHVVAANKVSRGRHRIVARRGEQPVHADVFDPSDAKRRGDFVKATVAALEHEAAAAGLAIQPSQLASVRGQLESQLLTLADELAAQEGQAPVHAQDDAFSNAGGDGLGRMIDEIADDLMERTGGWPRRVGSALFCEGTDGTPDLFGSSTELFAWLRARFPVVWQRGPDKVTQEEFFAHLRRTTQAYDVIERVPHWPPRPETYYMTPEVPPGDGSYLEMLLGVLNPATPIDRELIKAYLMTQAWGGAPGARPMFLVTGPEVDVQQGRGVGKSTLVTVTAPLFGGYLMATPKEDLPAIVKRLLSPEGRDKRVVLLDNLKTHRFSWSDLEGFITAPVISGHEMYRGEGRRPNTTTVVVTINGASLSKDLAQRCVIIRLARPEYDAEWAETVRDFVAKCRWQILGDLRSLLEGQASLAYEEHSRWPDWEARVLSKVHDPLACQSAILQRQAAVDDDASEAAIVAELFRAELVRRHFDPDGCYVLIPRELAIEWLERALGERLKTTKARAVLNGLGISEMKESAKDGTRGWMWTGKGASTEAGMVLVAEYQDDWPPPVWHGEVAPAAPNVTAGAHANGQVPE